VLSAEARAEVERLLAADPAVPGLRLLLDDDALGAWVARRLGPGSSVHGARRTYLRWKPGSGGVARVRLGGPAEAQVFLAVWHPDSAAKLDKTVDCGGADVVAVDLDALAVLALPRADRHLPALGRLLAPGVGAAVDRLRVSDAAARQLLRRAVAAPGAVRTLAWKPQRRWVGTVGSEACAQVVLRAYRPSATEGVLGRYRAVSLAVGEQSPQVLGSNLRRGLVAVEHLPGLTLDRLPSPDTTADSDVVVRATGQLVARLHAGAAPARGQVPELRVQDECAAVEAAAVTLDLLAPRSGARLVADKLLRRLRRLPEAPERLLHGDLSPDQVVVRADGGVGLIDLDEAVRGPAGYDLAGVAASWALLRPALAAGLVEQLLDGYGERLDVPDLEVMRVRTAAHLLRRAPEPFRSGSPTWPVQVRQAVGMAAEVLADGGPVLPGSTRVGAQR